MEGAQTPIPFLATPADETSAAFSPDGRWIAYSSDESGRPEVYVRGFAADGKMMAVPIKGGPVFEPGVPIPLFNTRVTGDRPTRTRVSTLGRSCS